MRKEVVYFASGENVGTYSPLCFHENFDGNLNETVLRCRSFDDDHQVLCNKYIVRTKDIPDWMDETTWLSQHISLVFLSGISGLDVINMKPEWYWKLSTLSECYQFFIGWIFNQKTTNSFMLSIRMQVEDWLNTPEPAHSKPLSTKQWESATRFCPLYKAKQISHQLYWSFN